MSKPKAQGTSWETAFVRLCENAGLVADRLPEGGLRDAGDVWIGDTPHRDPAMRDIPVLAWSRLVDTGDGRRHADGARHVVVIGVDDFLELARHAIQQDVSFVVECKSRERLNVTRALDQTAKKLAEWKRR